MLLLDGLTRVPARHLSPVIPATQRDDATSRPSLVKPGPVMH